MKNTHTPTLFLGLGGTGINVLLPVKTQMINVFGAVPTNIKFLLIDSDPEYFKTYFKTLDKSDNTRYRSSNRVYFDSTEIIHIQQSEIKQVYDPDETDSWIPKRIKDYEYGHHAHNYIKQSRPLGRSVFLTNYISKNIKQQIENSIKSITSVNLYKEENYINVGPPIIHLILSSCGGTGSGIFIDTIMLIRNTYPEAKLFGWLVLPGCFSDYPFTNNLLPNTYATLIEIDHLMGKDAVCDEKNWSNYPKQPYQFLYPGEEISRSLQSNKFFDNVFLFDSPETQKPELKQNSFEKISQILFILSTGVGNKIANILNNNLDYSFPSSNNCGNKRRNYFAAGISRLILNKEIISKIICFNITRQVISRLIHESDSLQKKYIEIFADALVEFEFKIRDLRAISSKHSINEILLDEQYENLIKLSSDTKIFNSLQSMIDKFQVETDSPDQIIQMIYNSVAEFINETFGKHDLLSVINDFDNDKFHSLFAKILELSIISLTIEEDKFAADSAKEKMERFICVIVESESEAKFILTEKKLVHFFSKIKQAYFIFQLTGKRHCVTFINIVGLFPASALKEALNYKAQFTLSVNNGGYHFSDTYFERNAMDLIDSPEHEGEALKWFAVGATLNRIVKLDGWFYLKQDCGSLIPLFFREGKQPICSRVISFDVFKKNNEYLDIVRSYYERSGGALTKKELTLKLISQYRFLDSEKFFLKSGVKMASFEIKHIFAEQKALIEFGITNGIDPEVFNR